VATASIALATRALSRQPSPPSTVPAALTMGSVPGALSAIALDPASIPSEAAVTTPAPPEAARCAPEPALEVRAAEPLPVTELLRLVKEKPAALPSASLGTPTRGSLWGGVELKDSEGILRAGGYGWGTESVVRSIERAVREVRRCFPGSPPLHVGDIARERGGWLRPHRSHQSGLDADIGYYYRGQATWYQHATAQNLDVGRTWALVRALIEGGNVEMIFMDFSVQRLVQAHIATLPEGERPAEDPFVNATKKDGIIRHAAVAMGHRLEDVLARLRGPRRPPKVPVSRSRRPSR
jgi:hypothetical protein